MKKLLMGILIASLTTLTMAKEIDMTKAKGTEQSVINSLTPPKAYMDTDQDVVLKAMFNVELDAKHVQKNNVKLKKITERQQSMIDGEVAYDAIENAVIFTPSKLLKHGYYEVEFKSLKAVKSKKEQQIKEIKYRFYVPEVINGHKLPPEPDPKVNNSTLLGVDVNDNGVRDDVERFIVIKYQDHHKIVTEIGFQGARAYQKILENPLNTAENHKALHDAMDCNHYFKLTAKYMNNGDSILVNHYVDDQYKSLQLNTKARVKAYLEYDNQLSGGIYKATPLGANEKSNCAFDVDGLLGGE